jgi:hypothetical protein
MKSRMSPDADFVAMTSGLTRERLYSNHLVDPSMCGGHFVSTICDRYLSDHQDDDADDEDIVGPRSVSVPRPLTFDLRPTTL